MGTAPERRPAWLRLSQAWAIATDAGTAAQGLVGENLGEGVMDLTTLPEKPEGWTKRMVCHLNFGRAGGSASYDVFDAEGRKAPFGWGCDSRKGGGRGFYVPECDGYLTWDEVRAHYASQGEAT